MKIAVYNYKGGVGKTRISLNLSLSLDFGVITNDVYSPLERVLDPERLLKLDIGQPIPDLPNDADVIFDLGGYPDERAVRILEISDFVLIPVMLDFGDLQVTLDFINEIQEFNNNIVVIANKTTKGDFEQIEEVIHEFFPQISVLEIKQSRALPNLFQERKSIRDMVNEGGMKKFHFTPIAEQFDAIIHHLNIG